MARCPSKYNPRWTPEHAASLLDEAEGSGLSDHAFAKRRGIDPKRLWWWRKRLDETKAKETKVAFVEPAVRSRSVVLTQCGSTEPNSSLRAADSSSSLAPYAVRRASPHGLPLAHYTH